MTASLAQLLRALHLLPRQLALLPRELEEILLERLQRRQAQRRVRSSPSTGMVFTAEQLAKLERSPIAKAAGEQARAWFMRMIEEAS
jgi:hypothetical protein